MSHPCTVSVVICTFNRSGNLPAALESVLAQRDAPPYEIIVVDNNSNDGTVDVIRAHQTPRHPHLRYVFEPRQGLPHARNAGIAAARAPIVAFTDDDIVVAADWVASIKRGFDRYPEADCIGGRVLPRWPGGAPPEWLTTKQLAPLALQDKGEKPVVVDRNNAAPCLIGANFAFRRGAFVKAGVFAPEYTRTQDREIQLRLWKAGGVGLYLPEIVTYVDVPPERLTKAHFRLWFGRAGRFHSRMGLLDVIDVEGRMVDPPLAHRRIGAAPAFLYRHLAGAVVQTASAIMRRDEVGALYHENRVRYLGQYIRERWRTASASPGSVIADTWRYLTTGRKVRPRSDGTDPAVKAGMGV